MRLLILIIFFNLPLFSQDLISREIAVTSFKGLILDLPAKFIFYPNQKSNNVILKINKNFLNAVDVRVKREKLIIQSIKNIHTNLPITVIIHSKAKGLDTISIEGVTNLNVTDIKSNDLSLNTQGVNKINFEKGQIQQLTLNAEDEYFIDFNDVTINKAFIQAEDIGNISLNVSKLLEVKLSDLAKVTYAGQANVLQTTEELAQLTRKD